VIRVEDDVALRSLMARYTDAVNRRDGQAWQATWAEDSEWNLMGNPVIGRDNIYALWQQMMGGFELALLVPSTCHFEVDGDTASGHWYLQEFTRSLDGQASSMVSHYGDRYIRVEGEWLYHCRAYNIIYNQTVSPDGQYTPLTQP
jgi:ketosteroid isomerase-like protein